MRTVRRRRRVRTAALMLSSAAVVAVIALVVGGVLDRTPNPPPAASPSPAEGVLVTDASQLIGTWRALTLGDRDVSAVRTRFGPLGVTFGRIDGSFSTVTWGAFDGCNTLGSEVMLDGDRLVVSRVMRSTLAACQDEPYADNPAAVRAAEQARLVPARGTSPARLVLLADGQVIATYAEVPTVTRTATPR